jgi:ParB family chromosome partitioning protein
MQAEADVLATLNALCKPGGLIAFSGRPIYQVERFAARKQKAEDIRTVEFLDQNGFSAIFRAGVWQYQKFHNRGQVEALAKVYIGEEFALTCGNEAHRPRADLTGSSWQVIGTKTAAPEWEAAVAREFDLPTPKGRYGRSQEVLDAIKAAPASG